MTYELYEVFNIKELPFPVLFIASVSIIICYLLLTCHLKQRFLNDFHYTLNCVMQNMTKYNTFLLFRKGLQ